MSKLETTLEVLLALLVGVAFLGVGLGGITYQLMHPPATGLDRRLVGMFIGLSVLGALIMPSIFTMLFPRVKSIYILVFPNGLPLPWGRRSTDVPGEAPQAPPPPAPPPFPPAPPTPPGESGP